MSVSGPDTYLILTLQNLETDAVAGCAEFPLNDLLVELRRQELHTSRGKYPLYDSSGRDQTGAVDISLQLL